MGHNIFYYYLFPISLKLCFFFFFFFSFLGNLLPHHPVFFVIRQNYDVLVIGGGATGTGIALDAQLRGLRVAIVDRDDFAAGTSSRSTKLIHGGVRYLENAFKKLDISQVRPVSFVNFFD